ncbi:Para-nitrobenzyl esterase [Pigmentiphaga humi]|uniref:Carboxylic ester hydrolase n=1 Tax=Pigmentiphaga humi TaxID=2478468 RepID=A0A3P4B889_9BURK|nr:carboxylesterase family protein [Pigmentiphaga humi]VCU71898.1 Para-nitrobenzyl esterase [Pigmentiphaga humi]
MSERIDVALSNGIVTGERERDVCRFSAIPYAQAPIGSLRFAPPVPSTWRGRLDATRPGPVAPQLPSRLRGAMGDFEASQSEDCLHLTVWTPSPDSRRRPVVVWLHGGAHQSGGGALDWYSGARLAARGDLVVVAPNYRLAALGWLCVPGEFANLGLLDNEAALDWVHEHIESFGGDPERITVMGQSAGAASIACLLMRAPRFDRAILQSAPLGRGLRSAEQAGQLADAMLEAAGVRSMGEARAAPIDAFLRAQQAPRVLDVLKAAGGNQNPFGPAADGEVLPIDANEALWRGCGKVDVLIGYTKDEMAAFPAFGVDPEAERVGDALFGAPSRRWAGDAVRSGRSAWLYRFDFAPSARFGACHCIELPFVFDTVDAFIEAPMMSGTMREDARRLTQDLQRAWVDFIRGGSPGWTAGPQPHIFS